MQQTIHTAPDTGTAPLTEAKTRTYTEDTAKTVRLRSAGMKGITGQLAENLTRNWLIGLRETNPAILDMFRERDLLPYREMLPWLGEFAGKYITGAYYIYRLTLNQALYAYILPFLDELMDCQAEDGYLGPFSRECRLTGSFSQKPDEVEGTWDAWSHYHIMYGLLLWYEETRDARYLRCAEKIAGLFLRKFYCPETGNKSLLELKSAESNLAPLHSFAMLYRVTGRQCYLDFALKTVRDLADDRAGNYIRCALNGIAFYQCPKPRWESLHIIMGLAELYRVTGNEDYLQTVKQVYASIQETDIHNTGAFSTDEQAIGTAFKSGNIETCCVVAYNALAVEVFRLTGDTKILDFLELSHYNACMGAWSPTGRWSTYHTPMAGERHANFHDISFQSRAGSPELNCCSVNAPRGIGMLSEWAVTKTDSALCINAYEDGEFVTEDNVRIRIGGGYPTYSRIEIIVENYIGKLALRIPGWSSGTTLSVSTGVTSDASQESEHLLQQENGCGIHASYVLPQEPISDNTCLALDVSSYTPNSDNTYMASESLQHIPIGNSPVASNVLSHAPTSDNIYMTSDSLIDDNSCATSDVLPHASIGANTCIASDNLQHTPSAGSYYYMSCTGSIRIELCLDFTTRYLEGKEEYDGCVSIYRGPILFGTDIRLAGGCSLLELPVLKRDEINSAPTVSEYGQIHIPLPCGITLGDFYHLGSSGCRYTTWLHAE